MEDAPFFVSTRCSPQLITFEFKDEETALITSKQCKIPCVHNGTFITFTGANAVDALAYIPKEKRESSQHIQHLLTTPNHVPRCKFAKIHPDAIIPFKTRESDVGYDLSIIGLHKVVNSTVLLFRTGLKMQVEPGWYAEIVPRSSIIKSGYMLANSVGIIDNTYMGELLVALAQIDPNAAPIEEYPFRGFQLIFRPQQHVFVTEVDESELSATERGEGGFGSTGK